MRITKQYISPVAQTLLDNNIAAMQAYKEIGDSIKSIVTRGRDHFIINNSEKNCNGVVPIKEPCYVKLEDSYLWYREKPLTYLQEEMKKGGPIDVYKEFSMGGQSPFRVGLEFETGNIASAHRAMNKLKIGLLVDELDLAILIMPVKELCFFLTDRVSNYEELEPYFKLLDDRPFIVFGFDAEHYSPNVPLLPKGKDGMSTRSIRKWANTE